MKDPGAPGGPWGGGWGEISHNTQKSHNSRKSHNRHGDMFQLEMKLQGGRKWVYRLRPYY